MQSTTVFYIVIALLISVLVAYLQYFYNVKNKPKINILLFALKAISLFLLIILFINPTIKKTEVVNVKPILSLLSDNSKSIPFFKEEVNVKELKNIILNNKKLKSKFDIKEFTFGNSLIAKDSLTFLDSNTNISQAITSANELYNEKIAPIVIFTDGNQTIGNDYEFLNSKQKIYPIVLGDTLKYTDLKISKLNVNKYSYINNKFPVEIFINYDGNEIVNTKLSIYKNANIIYSKNLKFSKLNKSKTLTVYLESSKEGLQYYSASLRKLQKEKNIKNNTKNFSVEVIIQQTKILILSSINHPDIGVLKKAIESNKQRKVDVSLVYNNEYNISDYQLVILYQVNDKFKNVFNALKNDKVNYLLINGTKTDYNFLNNLNLGFSKKSINKTEDYGVIFNNNFLPFLQKDIGFNHFNPLKDKFGEITFLKEYNTLLYQNINGIETQNPLLVTLEQNNLRSAILFGEDIWKWRAASFLNTNSFQDFDEFIGNLVQYLASNKKRNRLEVNTESIYPANSTINVSAFFTDKNYKFDARAALEITITNTKTKKQFKFPFSLKNNSYQAEIENLTSGIYSFNVSVIGQNIHKKGKFKITDYLIEEQFTNANNIKLEKLAINSKGMLFYKDQIKELIDELLNNKSFYTTQKSINKEQNLIDWKWIFFLIIGFLSAEWFVRKYYGKI